MENFTNTVNNCESINHSGSDHASFTVVIVPSIASVGGIQVKSAPTTVKLCNECFATALLTTGLNIVSAKSLGDAPVVTEVKHRRTKAQMAEERAKAEATNGTH